MPTSIINKIKFFLSDTKVTVAIIGLAIISRLIQLVYFYTIAFDASYQVIATHNFVSGHGVSLSKVLPADLSTTIYEPLIKWPPGYSFLLSPLYVLFNNNYVAAGLTLDIIVAVILIFVTRRILKLLDIPLHFINIYTLLSGFFIYHFYYIASSDAIAITAFIISIYYFISLLKTSHRWVRKTIAIIIALFISGLIKYLFIPVAFIIPVFLFLKGKADRSLFLKKAGIMSFLILFLSFGGFLAYQKFTTGSATYITQPERGIFPEHLLTAYPFFPGSFIKPETLAIGMSQPTEISGLIFSLFQCVHVLFFIFLIIHVVKKFKQRGLKGISADDSFFYLIFLISLSITVLLAFLSLRVQMEEYKQGFSWTYVQEPRYYGLINVLLHIGLFILYKYYHLRSLKYLKYVFYFLLLLMLPELFRGVLFNVKRVLNNKNESYFWQLEYRFQQYADEIIKKAVQKKSVDNIIVSGSSYYVNNRIAVYSHVPVMNEVEKLNDLSSLHTQKTVLLLLTINEHSVNDYKLLLSTPGIELAGNSQGFYFYTVYVTPH